MFFDTNGFESNPISIFLLQKSMTKNSLQGRQATISTLGIITAIAFSLIQSVPYATAMHDDDVPTWSSGSQTYYCTWSLGYVDNQYVDSCNDFDDAADTWNSVSSSTWNMTYNVFGLWVQSDPLGSDGPWAQTVVRYTGNPGTITSADITFNNDKTFGSGANPSGAGDFKTVSIHEQGHLLHLEHNTSSSSVMYYILPANTVRTIDSHDEDAIQGLY